MDRARKRELSFDELFSNVLSLFDDIVFNDTATNLTEPIFYRIYDDGIEFVWNSGLIFGVSIMTKSYVKKSPLELRPYFDHLARPTEVG